MGTGGTKMNYLTLQTHSSQQETAQLDTPLVTSQQGVLNVALTGRRGKNPLLTLVKIAMRHSPHRSLFCITPTFMIFTTFPPTPDS